MKREEAEKIKKGYIKADLIQCKKCKEYAVCVYTDRYSQAWHLFHGDIAWEGLRLVCGICGSDFT